MTTDLGVFATRKEDYVTVEATARSADVYVAEGGADMADRGTPDAPWKTIDFALEQVGHYATVSHPVTAHLAAGTYEEKVTLSPHVALTASMRT